MKKKGFVEKTLYGKDKEDFTIDSLPKNRFDAFIKVIKVNWLNLVFISMIVTLSFAPLYFINMAKNAYIYEKTQSLDANLIASFTISTNLIFSLISIPLFIFAFIVLSGATGLIKRMVFREGYLFWFDFFKEIKSGIKNNIVTGLIFSVILSICTFNYNFLSINSNLYNGIKIMVLIVVIIFLIFNLLTSLFNINLNSIYNLSVKNMYKNSFLLIFAKPIKSILFALIFIWPILLTIYAPNFILSIIFLVILFLFMSSIILLIFFLYSTYVFDIYINEKNCPSIYRKGLKK